MTTALAKSVSSVLGITEQKTPIQISHDVRREGFYLIGATGVGKSTTIASLALQDIDAGIGVCLIDPHGDLTDTILSRMTSRLEDVVLIDLVHQEHITGINFYDCADPTDKRLVQKTVNAVLHIFARLYDISRGTPQMAYYLRNCAYTLIANPGTTIAEIPRLLTDEPFRKYMLRRVTEQRVLHFWTEFEKVLANRYTYLQEVRPILNKIDEFIQPMQLSIFGQSTSTLNIRRIMEERKLLFIKLDEELEDLSSLFGATIVAHLLLTAYARQDIPPEKRVQFHVYADEFQLYSSEDFAKLFKEARKYSLGLTISHQVFEDIDPRIKAACKQAASVMVFRVSSDNSKEIAGAFDCSARPGIPHLDPLRTPVKEPIQHMLTHGVHPVETVREFVDRYGNLLVEGEKAEEDARKRAQGIQDRLTYSTSDWRVMPPPPPAYPEYSCRWSLQFLNTLLYQAMLYGKQEKDTDSIPLDPLVIDYFIKATYAPGIIYLNLSAEYAYTYPNVSDKTARIGELRNHLASLPLFRYTFLYPYYHKKRTAYRILYLVEKRIRNRDDWKEQDKISTAQSTVWQAKYDLTQAIAYIEQQITEQTETMEKELTLLEQIEQARPEYNTSCKELTEKIRQVMRDVSHARIEEPSGLMQEVPGPEISSTEVEARIANELKQLPKYTARIRTEAGEFTIQTPPPPPGVSLPELQERIKRIHEQNRKDGYVKLRSEVEAERAQRTPPLPAAQQVSQKTHKPKLEDLARRIPDPVPVQPLPQPRRK